MLFNSFAFALFFPIVVLLHALTPSRWRWLLLLVASCIFYMAFIPAYLLILFLLIGVDYVAALWIERSTGRRRTQILTASIFVTCCILLTFKYETFALTNLSSLALFLGWNFPIRTLGFVLPLGLSFHTFQSLSYVIEVYHGRQTAERHLGIYALYVMFFPQLVAGPIERPQHLLHQFHAPQALSAGRLVEGLRLMLWGFVQKMVIADRLADITTPLFSAPQHYFGPALILGSVAFAYQIYGDFAGYSNIARGSALVLGFDIMQNFNFPYAARSVADFWRRWHISLSTWFRDYVYIPLGGSRVPPWKHYRNLLITFMLSGLWHGANWTFVVWGAYFGVLLILSTITRSARESLWLFVGMHRLPRLQTALRVACTFCIVCVGWIFFRASTLGDAVYIITHLTQGTAQFVLLLFTNIPAAYSDLIAHGGLGVDRVTFLIAVLLVLGLEAIQFGLRNADLVNRFRVSPRWMRWSVYYCALVLLVSLGVFEDRQFMYFRF